MDTRGELLALVATSANEAENRQVERLAEAVQEVTGGTVELAYVDAGYRGEDPKTAAKKAGIPLEVVKLPGAKKGFVPLPRRWIVERSFAWASRFRRWVKD